MPGQPAILADHAVPGPRDEEGDDVHSLSVIPAKAGISGRKVTAGLAETPAFAGVTESSRNGVSPWSR